MKKQDFILTVLLLNLFHFLNAQVITTLAGGSGLGYVDGAGTIAKFESPLSITVGSDSNIYVGDKNRIRKITPSGVVSTFAGSGECSNIDGYGTNASFCGVNIKSGGGNLYVNARRIVTLGGQVTSFICDNCGGSDFTWTPEKIVMGVFNQIRIKNNGSSFAYIFAGSPTNQSGNSDGIGLNATFNNIAGICNDNFGNYYVTETDSHRIRKVSSNAEVTTIAGSTFGFLDGTGTNAKFYNPQGICVDYLGNLYVADFRNSRIRKISPNGTVTTITPDLSPYQPKAICIDDSSGNIYFTAFHNYNSKIFKISDYNLDLSENESIQDIKIYPNPANDHITIDFGTLNNYESYKIKVANALGQEVFNQSINTQQNYLQLNSLTLKGIYFVNIIDGQGHTVVVKKIILE